MAALRAFARVCVRLACRACLARSQAALLVAYFHAALAPAPAWVAEQCVGGGGGAVVGLGGLPSMFRLVPHLLGWPSLGLPFAEADVVRFCL